MANLPEVVVTASPLPASPDNPYRVRLSSRTPQPPYNFNRVVFQVSPELVEQRTVNYTSLDPVHMPGQIYVYKNSQARSFSISGAKLLSRTPQEADQTLIKLWMLRGWTMPRFGINSSMTQNPNANQGSTGQLTQPALPIKLFTDSKFLNGGPKGNLLGAPPEILYLSAYSNLPPPSTSSTSATSGSGDSSGGASSAASNTTGQGDPFSGMIANVPVVISSLNIPYPTDVDYIKAASSDVRVPIVMSIDISLLEAHSAAEYEQFNLDAFKQGILPGF